MSFLLLSTPRDGGNGNDDDSDEQAVLADALAFIDAFASDCDDATEANSSSSSSSTSNDSSSSDERSDVSTGLGRSLYVEVRIPKSPASGNENSDYGSNRSSRSHANTPEDASPAQKKLLRNRALNTRAVHRYRNRTKMEIAALRDELLQLQALLAKLQRRSTATTTTASPGARTSHTHGTPLLLLQLETGSSAGIEDAVAEYKRLQQAEVLNRRLRDAVCKQRSVSATLERMFTRQVAKHVRLECVC